MIYKYSDYYFDTFMNTLSHKETKLKLRHKSFKLMCYLIDNRYHVVSKDDLIMNIWSDVCVGYHVIFQSIVEIRSILGNKDCIITHPREGYQWTADVEVINNHALPDFNERSSIQNIVGAQGRSTLNYMTSQPRNY